MPDHEPLSHIIVKGLFALLRDRLVIGAVLVGFLVWMGWNSDDISAMARNVSDSVARFLE
jgi:hypothetical protein